MILNSTAAAVSTTRATAAISPGSSSGMAKNKPRVGDTGDDEEAVLAFDAALVRDSWSFKKMLMLCFVCRQCAIGGCRTTQDNFDVRYTSFKQSEYTIRGKS